MHSICKRAIILCWSLLRLHAVGVVRMPVYTYHCGKCDVEFDRYQGFEDEPLVTCPECSKKALHRVYKPTLIIFKGKGFYSTDHHASQALSTTNNGKKKDSIEKEEKSKSKPAASKQETKADTSE